MIFERAAFPQDVFIPLNISIYEIQILNEQL